MAQPSEGGGDVAVNSFPRVRALSLFSGIGGFEIGMRDLGFDFLAQLEVDRACCETLTANELISSGVVVNPTDITTTLPEDFYSGSDVDYIVGGPPCQSFSAAGRRAGGVRGTQDARGTLFWYYCRYVEHFKPKAFVFENVRGILSSAKGKDFEIIRSSFEEVGYNLYWRVLNSADYGAPQFRERLYLVGIRRDINVEFSFPRPTHGPDSADGTPYVTPQDVLEDLDDPDEVVEPFPGKYGPLIPEIPEGENYRHFTEEMGHPEPRFAWRSRFSGFLYKMARDTPCRTIVSQQSQYDGPLHWRNRKCTTAELQRLQGFPADFVFPVSYREAVKQIGNSVTPPVAAALGRALLAQVEGRPDQGVDLMDSSEVLGFDQRKGARARASRAKKAMSYGDLNSDPFLPGLGEVQETDYHDAFSKTYAHGDIEVSASFSDGVGSVETRTAGVADCVMAISLEFFGGVTRKIRSIEMTVDACDQSLKALSESWQAAHKLVAEVTSYPSLLPLWGHFTEPYPKFALEVGLARGSKGCLMARAQLLAASTTARSGPFSIETIDSGDLDPEDFLARMSQAGFDVRTANTNPTLPEGVVRVCYPFVLPED